MISRFRITGLSRPEEGTREVQAEIAALSGVTGVQIERLLSNYAIVTVTSTWSLTEREVQSAVSAAGPYRVLSDEG